MCGMFLPDQGWSLPCARAIEYGAIGHCRACAAFAVASPVSRLVLARVSPRAGNRPFGLWETYPHLSGPTGVAVFILAAIFSNEFRIGVNGVGSWCSPS